MAIVGNDNLIGVIFGNNAINDRDSASDSRLHGLFAHG